MFTQSKSEFSPKEILFDASTRRYEMHVRPIEEQEPHESRRKWANVTYNLYKGDVEKATAYKNQIEEEQRKKKEIAVISGKPWKPK